MSVDRSALAEWIGKESAPIRAPDKVSKSDIRHWCEVVGDPDPGYADKIKAGEKTVPPAMLPVWAKDVLWPKKTQAVEPHEKVFALLDEAGYEGALEIGLRQEFLRSVPIGERLSFRVKVAAVSEQEERTMLGRGHVVDLDYTFLNSAGEVVGTEQCAVLKFRVLEIQP